MSSEWPSVKLSELINIKHGFAFKGEYFSDTPTTYQLTTPGNFSIEGGFQLGKGKYYSGPIPEDYILSPGDLIVTMTDLSKAGDTLGYAAVVPDTRGSIYLHNQRVGLVQIKSYFKILPNFLHYLMRSDGYRHWIISSASGSTVKHTSPGRICEYKFNLPSVFEQAQIGSILTVLDNRIALLRETNKTLEAIAQAIFKSWFVDFDPVRAKQEGREPEGMDADTAALFPDSFEDSELGLIPKGWRAGTLGDISCVKGGFAYKSDVFCDAGSPVVKIKNIVGDGTVDLLNAQFIADDIANKTQKFGLKDGDIVIAMTGATIGKTGVIVTTEDQVPYLNQRVAKFESDLKGFNNSWLIFVAFQNKFIFEQVVNAASGSAQPNISTNGIESVCLVIPDNNELMSIFNEYISVIFQGWIANQKQSKTLTQLRDTLLPRLISGQLRLPDAESMFEEATA